MNKFYNYTLVELTNKANIVDSLGRDKLLDSLGNDTLNFAEGITKDDLLIKTNATDIVIYINPTNKALNEVTDKIIIKDWHTDTNRLENINFFDGSSLHVEDITAMFGTDEDDSISATNGADILNGAKGDDTLLGGAGSDRYVFNLGDGIDTITDSSGYDTIEFGDSITADKLLFKAMGNDMIVAIKEDGVEFADLSQAILIKDWYTPTNRVEEISFSDNTTLSINDMLIGLGTDGNDFINGTELDDTLHGAQGDDTLNGKKGDDTYLFNLGDGKDTVIDSSGVDTLIFGDGIVADDLVFETYADKLKIVVNNQDSITINNAFNLNTNIENFSFSDGITLSFNDLEKYGVFNSDNNIIGTSSNDVLIGGTGNDTLAGGAGNDTYIYNLGDGQDTIIDSLGTNKISLGEGISKENLSFSVEGSTLHVELSDGGLLTYESLSEVILPTCRQEIANNIFIFSLHVEQIKEEREIAQ